MMGAFGADLIALRFPDLPKTILILSMVVSGMIFGGICALIPAYFRVN